MACILLLAQAPALAQERFEIPGKRLVVYAPPSDKAAAKRIAESGDHALERYAADLGVKLPETRFKVFLYATEAEYVKAEESRTHGTFKTNLAFTYAKDGEVHMVFQPRTNRGSIGDASGMLEALAMHELSHALQYKTVASYDEQPDWLSEGVAELCAERAVGAADEGCAGRVPWFADFLWDTREALDVGTFVPLDRLIGEGLQGKDVQDRQVRYGESWALVRWLDSAQDPARRQKFRGFLKDVMALPPGKDVAARANARFREVFGQPVQGGQPSLVNLERDLVKAIEAEDAFPWQILFRDLRANTDGSLAVEAFPESSALAVAVGAPLGPRFRIKAKVAIADTGGRQADLIFAYRGPNEFYKLAFGAQGYITLMRYDGKWTSIANAAIAPEVLAPSTPHDIEVIGDVARLYAKVGGKLVFRFTLPDRTFGSGRFGIGAYDGRATFSGIEATPLGGGQ